MNALAALSRSVDMELEEAFGGRWEGRELVWQGAPEAVVGLAAEFSNGPNILYSLECRFPNADRGVRVESENLVLNGKAQSALPKNTSETYVHAVCIRNISADAEMTQACRFVYESLSGVHYYRWNPRALALPVAPDSSRRYRLNSDGFGLALLLDDILGFDRKRFEDLEAKFTAIFPSVKSIRLVREMGFRASLDDTDQVSVLDLGDGKGLFFELKGSKQQMPASQASDGAMLILAYLAVLYTPQPPRFLLIEEPENGIHPKRLQDVLKILREIVQAQSHTQVLLTTHSPYAVDLFSPEEVTLCTRQEDGSIALTRLADADAVREQNSVFSLGEIWTAEGDEKLAQGRGAASS